jgi:hypothetical protein
LPCQDGAGPDHVRFGHLARTAVHPKATAELTEEPCKSVLVRNGIDARQDEVRMIRHQRHRDHLGKGATQMLP